MDLKRGESEQGHFTTKGESEHVSVDRASDGWVLDLPLHLIYEILFRLSIETIFICKCVCKMFLEIIADPSFVEYHLTKTPNVDHSLIVQNNYYPSDFSFAYISDLEKTSSFPSLNIDCDSNSLPWRKLTIPTLISQMDADFITSIIGSCNGLLCLSYYNNGLTVYYVCNPILCEFMVLPQNKFYANQVAAFGFCPKTKQYKVIRFLTTTYCEIHTLGTNNWRKIENVPYPDHPASMDSSLNGNLHWITASSNISNTICSLNLETEQFHFISLPSHFNQDTMRRICYMRVGALGGLFCIYYLFDGTQLEVFVMKEYGVEMSWNKELKVNLMFDFLWQSIEIIPMKLLNDGDLLVRYNYNNLVYYSFRKGIFRELIAPGFYHVVDHAPSFVSLKDLVGEYMEVVKTHEFVLEIEENGFFGINLSTAAESENPYNAIVFPPFFGSVLVGVLEGGEWPKWTGGHQEQFTRTYRIAREFYGDNLADLDRHISQQMGRPISQISNIQPFSEAIMQALERASAYGADMG